MPLLGVLLTVPPWLLDIIFNPSCTKVFGTHTFYQGRVESTRPHDLENGRLYKLQLWQAIRTIYER